MTEPMDRDVLPHMTEWGVPVQPIVTINGKVIYGLQPKQELCFHHTPLSEQWEERGSPTMIGFGGAAGGAKSHTARAIAMRAAFQWPGCTGIIFRKTQGEVETNHVSKFQEEVPGHLFEYRGSPRMRLTWCNNSKLFFGFLRNDDDKFKYQGPEYDFMIFEEATHYSFETVNWLVGNRLRATVKGAIPFALFPSNPGNVGHFWFKKWFIDKRYDPERDEQPEDYAFIQAFLEDNQILCRRDPKYLRKMNTLPEPWRSWLRDGDFEAGAGLFFHELDRRLHLVDEFNPPAHWTYFAGFDWGFAHPWALAVWTANEDGTCYKRCTIRGRQQTYKQIVDQILEELPRYRIDPGEVIIHAGHDTFHSRGKETGFEGPTMAERMIDAGLVVVPANTERIRGANNMREYFHWIPEEGTPGTPDYQPYIPPGAFYMRNAANLKAFECIETRVADEDRNLEDVLKTDADPFGEGGDDDYDADRYALASRPERAMSVGLETPISAFDPEVLAHEARVMRTVRDLPLKSRLDRDHPEWGSR